MSARKKKVVEEEHENHERWAISYMDMVTVMMCLFIVLFAISQVDQQKLETLAHSLGAAFGAPNSEMSVMEGGESILDGHGKVPTDEINARPEEPLPRPSGLPQDDDTQRAAGIELAQMEELRGILQADLEARGLASSVSFRYTSRGLVVGLSAENVFFAARSAEMTGTAAEVVDVLSANVRNLSNHVSVEGHANILQNTAPYETNWELSADRAVKVLRRMVEVGGIPGERMSSVGYGDAHPLATDEPNALDINRRVDIVIESQASAEVKDALSQMLGQSGKEN